MHVSIRKVPFLIILPTVRIISAVDEHAAYYVTAPSTLDPTGRSRRVAQSA